jgi:hypothetical protein
VDTDAAIRAATDKLRVVATQRQAAHTLQHWLAIMYAGHLYSRPVSLHHLQSAHMQSMLLKAKHGDKAGLGH